MNSRTRSAVAPRASILLLSIATFCTPLRAADISKLQNTSALNTGAAWNGGGIPGVGDVMLWDNLYTAPGNAASLSQLGGDLSVLGIKVTNVGGAVNAAATAVGFQDTGSAHTVTIGASGINMAAATQTLLIQSKITVGADQTWNIINANTNINPTGQNNNEDLCFFGQAGTLTSSGAAFELGNHVVTTTGTGNIDIGNGYLVAHGTINIGNANFVVQGGGSKLTTIDSTVTLNVAANSSLWFFTTSGGVTSNGTINLNGGNLRIANNNATTDCTLTGALNVNSASALVMNNAMGGNGGAAAGFLRINSNIAGSANLAVSNTTTAAQNNGNRLLFGGDNSGYSGTISFTGNARESRLTAATAGSAAATWVINAGHTLGIDGVSVQFGTLNGAGTLTNSHATNPATINVGAGTFTGLITNGAGTGKLGLTKVGSGILTLSGANTFSGPTSVNAGTLVLGPGTIGASAISVATGATLSANVANGGDLGAASLTVADGGTFEVKETTSPTILSVASVSLGATTGANLTINNAAYPNPSFAPLLVSGDFGAVAALKVNVVGTGLSVQNGIPIVQYGSRSGVPVSSYTLSLPPRTIGNLVDDSGLGQILLNITALEQIKWKGSVNSNWDLDPDGSGGQGTANWVTTVAFTPTKYLQGTGGTDSVNFDDSAIITTVNLTTSLSPVVANFTNATNNYVLSGPGKLTGAGAMTMNGTAKVTLLNTVAYDNAGGLTINSGTVQFGDGATANAGLLPTTAVNIVAGTLIVNRVEDLTSTSVFTGAGTLEKRGPNVATLSATSNFTGGINVKGGTLNFANNGAVAGAVTIDAGATLRYSGTSTISSTVSGAGTLEITGGTVQLAGADPNTVAITNVSGGILQLNKNAGVNAVAGSITLTGNGALQLIGNEQIPDTATIFQLGSSTEGMTQTSTGTETVANLVVNGSVNTAQLIMRNNFTATDTATVQNGILAAASGHTANVNKIVLSAGGTVRMAASSAASTLNVGAGGIVASGGTIEVKFNTNNFDAILNLNGDFTSTGNVAINNAGYTGANLNVIRLNGDRTFNIGAGTTTTVAPDFDGTGNFIKSGGGTLQLTATSTMGQTGSTAINAGTLLVTGSISGTTGVTVNAGGTLAGTGTISPVFGGAITVAVGGTLSPGNAGAGTLTASLAVGTLDLSPAATGSGSLRFDLAAPGASDKIAVVGGTLNIGTNALDFNDFAFTALAGFDPAGTYTLFDGDTAINGTLGSATTGIVGGQAFQLQLGDNGNDLLLVSVPEPGTVVCFLGGLATLGFLPRKRNRKSLL